jgi:hypothetical protein
MQILTEVRNLSTDQVLHYTLPPEQAVVCAWYQGQNNWNTWDYDYENAPVVEGKYTVACGDWCALKKEACDAIQDSL